MRPLKIKISITLDPETLEKIRILSETADRSLSQYINMVLREHIVLLEHTEQTKPFTYF